MNEPNVTMYSSVIDHVCLSLKISNCFFRFGFMSPKATSFIASSVPTMISGIATHMLSTPSPVGAAGTGTGRCAAVTIATP